MVLASCIFECLREVFIVLKAFVTFEVFRAVGVLEVFEEKGVFGDFEAVVFKVFRIIEALLLLGLWGGRVGSS